MVTEIGYNRRNAFEDISNRWSATATKFLWKARGAYTSILANQPRNRGVPPSLTPCRSTSGTLQCTLLKVGPKFILPWYSHKNQLELTQDMKSRREQASNIVLHWIHMEPFSIMVHAVTVLHSAIPWHLLHGPFQCQRVDEPHPTSIGACTWPSVAGSASKEIVQVVWEGSCVAYGYNWQFSQDIMHGTDIENGFLVVKLVNHPRLALSQFIPTILTKNN